MSGQTATRTGRSQVSGDVVRGRVLDLVAEHRETVLAMEQAIAERAEQQRAELAAYQVLFGRIARVVSEISVATDATRLETIRWHLDTFKAERAR